MSETDSSSNNTTTQVGNEGSTPNAIWNRLLKGNERFSNDRSIHPHQDRQTRETLVAGQQPRVAVLSCSDSREIPELIFDQGFGDMFTIRTAGQMLDAAVIASLEYAVQHLHVRLIVVLGHEHCGAVESAVEALDQLNKTLDGTATTDGATRNRHLNELIDQSDSVIIRSVGASVQQARESDLSDNADFERVHVARTVEQIAEQSPAIREALALGRVSIVGARYLLSSGKVEVLSF